jgi:transposase
MVERLEGELAALRLENERLRQELKQAQERIAELERAAARQAAPFRRAEANKVPASERKRPGRKPGHRGAYRAVPEYVDQEVEVPLDCCPQCGGQVEDRAPLVQYIEELPPVRPVVTRLVTFTARCPQCGLVGSTHPLQTSRGQGAAGVQLGPRALAVAALLNKHLGLSMRKTCHVLRRLCSLRVTGGGLSHALARVARKTQADYEALVEQIRGSAAVHADETSWWVGGPGWWLWTFTTDQATVYRVDACRGSQVVKEVLGDQFTGMLVSDCLGSYDPLPYRKHKCIAHHQRAIAQARDRPDTPDASYLDQWRWIFKAVCALWKARPSMGAEAFVDERARIEAAIQRLLDQSVTQPGDVAVQNRLLKQWPHLVGCLYEPAAEPTNNRAERSLRPAVIARKLSCGNKTEHGQQTWQILASLAATCQQTAQEFVDYLTPKLLLATQVR